MKILVFKNIPDMLWAILKTFIMMAFLVLLVMVMMGYQQINWLDFWKWIFMASTSAVIVYSTIKKIFLKK